MMKRWKSGVALRAGSLLALVCLVVAVAARGVETAAPAAIRILSTQEVPPLSAPALNLRWASDHSLYLSRLDQGVTEVALDSKLTALRQPIPDRVTLHAVFPTFERMAISPDYFVVASLLGRVGYRPRTADAAGAYPFTKLWLTAVDGLDLQGNRLLLLGDPTPARDDTLQSHGEIAWIGPLSGHPERDLKPFLSDVAGPRAPSLYNCNTLELGAVRFLADGSYLVVPGFQDGIHLYGPAGQLQRTWKNADVGLDAPACASLDPKQEEQFRGSYAARFDFLNQHRIVEEILPLREGPGLLIRYVAGNTVHWTLNVLHGDTITRYPVPITGDLPFDRLRADVRGDQIAFLRTWYAFGAHPDLRLSHLYSAAFSPAPQEVAP
jgi:hypothetical protein